MSAEPLGFAAGDTPILQAGGERMLAQLTGQAAPQPASHPPASLPPASRPTASHPTASHQDALYRRAFDAAAEPLTIGPPDQYRLGRIVSATGPQVIVLLEADAPRRSMIQMGSLVKVQLPGVSVFGIVNGLNIPLPSSDGFAPEVQIAEVDLLGEVPEPPPGQEAQFRRGVSQLPTLNDVVMRASEAEIRIVFAQPGHHTVRIGTLHQDPEVEARVSINEMLGKHFALLGTTGTGKSCALTLILKRILANNPNAHVLLLDPHGEYAAAFPDCAEHLTAENLKIPYWLFNFEEIVEVIFGSDAHESVAETLYLRELIVAAKLRFVGAGKDPSRVTVDVPIPYSMSDLNRMLDEAIGKLDNRADLGPYLRIKSRLAALQSDRRYAFMFPRGLAMVDNLSRFLGRIFRVPVDGKPLAILDLAGVPSEILNVVVAVLCRMAFDFSLWSGQELPLLLVCEEAHRYVPQDTSRGFEPAKRALSRIAKEGRKYGISLCVVSQRPSELAASLLSQCNTVFALRMANQKDQDIIRATLSEISSSLLTALPILGTAEAIAIGEGVPLPMRLRFDQLPPEERPRSSSASFSTSWQNDDATVGLLDKIVDFWRYQAPGELPPV